MSSLGRRHSTRATGATAPLAIAVDVSSLWPHRFFPVRRWSARPMPFTGLSAVRTGRAARPFLAIRSHRAFARWRYRAEALIPRRTGQPADLGLVSQTGREPGDDGRGTAGRTIPGGPVLSTGRLSRPIPSWPYRVVGGLLRTGHRVVPVVLECRSRSSRWFWWTQYNKGLKQASVAGGPTAAEATGSRPPLLSPGVVPSDRGRA